MASPDFAYTLNAPAAVPTAATAKVRKLAVPSSSIRWAVAALLGTLLAWPLAINLDGRFPVENLSVEMTNRIRNNRDDAVAWAKERSNRWESMYRTAVACLTGFGATLGGVAALLGVATPAPILARVRWTLAGVILGAAAAALGGYLEAGLLIKIEKFKLDPMYSTILGHAVAWLILGAGMAFAATISRPGWSAKRAALGRSVLGALGAATLYSPIAAILFQLERSDLPIPEGGLNKLLFLGLAGTLIGGMLGHVPRQVAVAAQSTNDNATSPVPETSRMVTA